MFTRLTVFTFIEGKLVKVLNTLFQIVQMWRANQGKNLKKFNFSKSVEIFSKFSILNYKIAKNRDKRCITLLRNFIIFSIYYHKYNDSHKINISKYKNHNYSKKKKNQNHKTFI